MLAYPDPDPDPDPDPEPDPDPDPNPDPDQDLEPDPDPDPIAPLTLFLAKSLRNVLQRQPTIFLHNLFKQL